MIAIPITIKAIALAAVVGFAAGIGTTLYVSGVLHDAAETKSLVGQVKAQKVVSGILRAADAKAIGGLMARQKEIQIVYRTVEKERNVYVQANPACNLTVGAVGLLNDLRAKSDPGLAERLPSSAGLSEEERGATTDFTLRDEHSAHSECAAKYAELKLTNDKLNDWLDDVYGPPQEQDDQQDHQ